MPAHAGIQLFATPPHLDTGLRRYDEKNTRRIKL